METYEKMRQLLWRRIDEMLLNGVSLSDTVNTIIGSYWDKHKNQHIRCRMPATKEVKYLKNYRVE